MVGGKTGDHGGDTGFTGQQYLSTGGSVDVREVLIYNLTILQTRQGRMGKKGRNAYVTGAISDLRQL